MVPRLRDVLAALPAPISRREASRILVGLTGLAAAAIGPSEDVHARRRRRRCRPACTACQRCKKGRCKPLPDGRACGTCRTCQAGTCAPTPDGTSCGECLVCGGGECLTVAPDGTACRGTGQCGAGRCVPEPTCLPFLARLESCTPSIAETCCKGLCGFITLGSAYICFPAGKGDPCRTDADCAETPGLVCRVFTCVVG